MMEWLAPLLVGVALDYGLGEVRRWHPVVLFAAWAEWVREKIEARFASHYSLKMCGVLSWSAAVLPWVILAAVLRVVFPWTWLFDGIVLYFALGWRSLSEHAEPIERALQANDLPAAREAVSRIVSRDTQALDDTGVARAATESVLENGSDAVFASLFWCLVAGAPGIVLHRFANTLDAMWGYRNERWLERGWAAARIDDVLGYVPARLTALTYALCGRTALALRCWQQQAPQWDSPNAGPVMAAGAGALGVSLGGGGMYHGQWHVRPTLGEGPEASAGSIRAAVALVRNGVWLWLACVAIVAGGLLA